MLGSSAVNTWQLCHRLFCKGKTIVNILDDGLFICGKSYTFLKRRVRLNTSKWIKLIRNTETKYELAYNRNQRSIERTCFLF